MDSSQRIWSGASDLSRKIPGEYFIPKSLQSDFGSLLPFLGTFATDTRTERFVRVSKARSRFIVPVFENTHHSHNISAILRTADALGLQDAIFCYSETDMRFRLKDSVERGSSDWLSPRRAGSVTQCAETLRASGFCILAVSLPSFERTAEHYRGGLPSFSAQNIDSPHFESFRAGRKVALIFGNELHGVSEEGTSQADGYVHVDMHGFVESLNVSVCAGILLQALRCSLEAKEPGFRISDDERGLLLEHWMARSVTRATELVQVHRPALWPYFDFVRKGLFFDPFNNLHVRKPRL
jgi:tRNA (guanosine-2'-O-)-methyltransferase